MRKFALVVGIIVALGLAAAPAGAAAPEVVHTKVNVSLPGIDVCGFTVDSVVKGTNTFQMFVDRFGNVSIQDVSHVVSTLTNEANGKVVHVEAAGRDAFQPDPVVNRDGTITATDTLNAIGDDFLEETPPPKPLPTTSG